MSEKNRVAKLFRLFAAAIDNLTSDEVDQLIAGKIKLIVDLPKKPRSTLSAEAQGQVLAKLNDVKDREEARRILSTIEGRETLASLARALKVHVVKHDRREEIEAKIVEFVIGGQLRSEAIRSLNFKGGGPQTK